MTTVAFDTETGGLDWFEPGQQAFLLTWDVDGQPYHADVTDRQGVEEFKDDLRGADKIVGANLPFDIHQVRATLGFDILELDALLWDIQIMSRVLHPDGQSKGGHGLDALEKRWLDRDSKAQYQDRMKAVAKSLGGTMTTPGMYRRVYEADPDLLIAYAMADAVTTADIFQVFMDQRPYAANLERVLLLEHELMPVVIRAEQRGVAVDQEYVTKFKAEFEQQERELRTRLMTELGGTPASDKDNEEILLDGKGSQKFLREALEKIGVPLTQTTRDGRLSTSRAVLQPLADEFPVITDLFEWRRVVRFLNTYIGPMVGRDVIHTSYQQNEAWTGRMASRRPNMQNWPRRAGQEVRNVLRARPGHKLVIADYAQMEAMIIVRYLNDPSLIEALDGGMDMNAWTAARIWGGEPADWGKDTPNAEGEQSRATARHTLYATLYGAGAGKVTAQLPFLDPGPYFEQHAPEVLRNRDTGDLVLQKPWRDTYWPQPGWQYHAARDLQKAIRDGLPGYWDFRERLDRKIDRAGHVNTIYGRQNPVGRNKKYVAVAAIVQGTGADILKLAAVNAARALEPLGAQLVMFTHDELVAEAPDETAAAALAALVGAMENAYPEHRPRLRADGAIVTNYGEAH